MTRAEDSNRSASLSRLGDVVVEVDVRAGEEWADLPVLSLTRERGLIPQAERFNHRVATEDVSKYKVVREGQLVYNPYVLWEGAIHTLRDLPAGLVSPVYPVWEASGVDPWYLDFLLRSPSLIEAYERVASGTVKRRRSISKTDFLNIEVALPGVAEQRSIADALIRLREGSRAHAQERSAVRTLKNSLLKRVFERGATGDAESVETEYGRAPRSWPITALDTVAVVQTGLAKGRKLGNEPSVELPYLRVANVQDGWLDLAEMKTISLPEREVERYLLQPGDVVVTEGGDADKLGRGFLWTGQLDRCVHQNHVFVIRPQRDVLLPEFLSYFVQTTFAKSYFLNVAHRTTNLACINSTKLKALPIPLPAVEEQCEIVSVLKSIDEKRDSVEAGCRAVDALLRSTATSVLRPPGPTE